MVERVAEPQAIDKAQADEAVLEKMRAQLSGPRTMKEPGSPDWCWQTIGHLQLMWEFFESAGGSYLSVMEEAKAYKVWEVVPESNPFGTKEKMVEALKIGDEQAARDRLRQEALQAVALRMKPGRPVQVDGNPYHDKDLPYGSSTAYLMARIARDNPDVLERVKAGEFKSAAEAARAAGIKVTRTKTTALSDNVERLAARLLAHYDLDRFDALVQRMLQLRKQSSGKTPPNRP